MSRRRNSGPKILRTKADAKLRRTDSKNAARARKVTQRAIRRLDLLEWVMWGSGAMMAMVGGGVIAWFMGVALGWSFRPTWLVLSILLFVIPGGVAIMKIRKDERDYDSRTRNWMSENG